MRKSTSFPLRVKPSLFLFLFLAPMGLPPAAIAEVQTLNVDRGKSTVEVAVKATVDSFDAQVTAFDLAIVVDGETQNVLSAQFHFTFTDLKTGDGDRDAEMYKWEGADRFPDAGFTLDSIEPATVGYTAHGRLRFHGVERSVVFPATARAEKNVLTIDGGAPLDTRDYGLPIYRRFIFFSVNPVVQVRFHLVGKLAAP